MSDTSKPPYSYKFTFVKEGYESVTELFSGGYFDASKGYYLVKPTSGGVMAFLKRDENAIRESDSGSFRKRN